MKSERSFGRTSVLVRRALVLLDIHDAGYGWVTGVRADTGNERARLHPGDSSHREDGNRIIR